MTEIAYQNQTTLITGASAGLGAEFARQLARRGSDLILVARRQERLEKLAAELTAAHGTHVAVIPMDLAAPDAGPRLATEVDRRGLRVTGLINNAGFGMYGPFHEADPAKLMQMVNLNMVSLVSITQTFIGRLRAADHGLLINIASTAAYQPTPTMAGYGASKAFVLSFTESLWQESLGTGLQVLALSPGPTSTEFFDVVGTTDAAVGRTQSPEQVVSLALATLGRRNPPPSVISGLGNRVLATATRLVSRRRVVAMAAASVGAPRSA
jgi:short-subunit dehydrogenase